MPEGDTLFRTATTLQKALGGARITGFATRVPSVLAELTARPALGRVIEKIEAKGKHLLIRLDDGRALRTHLRMSGSWHLYRDGEPWRRSEAQARVAIRAGGFAAVCFNAPEVELLSPQALERHEALNRLGPDLTTDAPDLREALARLRARGDLPLGVALLTQSAVAGIGNVIKSETMFLEHADPFVPVRDWSDAELSRLLLRGHRVLVDNRVAGSRTTRRAFHGPRLWVYGRSGKPCLRCGTPIRMLRQGTTGRSTFWCSSCQHGPVR